jgi:hypothetical protein
VRKPVRRFGQVVPELSPRMMFYACRCGTIVVWEDERQPTRKVWDNNIEFLKEAGGDVLIFNGDKPIPPGFQGVN